MKFISLENAYGIKTIKNIVLLNKNAFIYAPNGVMKTSFADSIENIKNATDFVDVFNNKKCIYKIEQNGKVFSNDNNDGSIEAIVFSEKTATMDIFDKPDLAWLAMSATTRLEYEKVVSRLQDVKTQLDGIVSINIKGQKKRTSESSQYLVDLFKSKNFINAFDELLMIKPYDEILLNSFSFSSLCSSKILNAFQNETFQNAINDYSSIIKKKMEDPIFINGFSFNDLKDIYELELSNNYFEAGHKNYIDGQTYNKEGLNSLLKEKEVIIFGSDEVERAFNNVKNALSKNADVKRFSVALEKNKEILKYSNDFARAQKQFCRNKLIGFEKQVIELTQEYKKKKKELVDIIKIAKGQNNRWKDVKDLFNSRFALNRLDLDIDVEEIDGLPIPTIIKIDKITKQPLLETQIERFSRGEKRAILILNLLYEITLKFETGKEFLLVLDDIADSFDYKNKYAIIKYILELSHNSYIHLIVLTHNFDFFRSCILKTESDPFSKLFAQKKHRYVTLMNANSNSLKYLYFFADWKKKLIEDDYNPVELISILPLIRNQMELETIKDKVSYKNMCHFLHFNADLNLNLREISNIIKKYIGDIKEDYYQKNYHDILSDAFSKIIKKNSISDIDILYKMTISVLIRIYFETFIINKSKSNIKNASKENVVNKLYQKLKDNNLLSPKDIEVCEYAMLVANPYVHVNAFMYEQLIDNPSDQMIDCLKYFVPLIKR